MIGNDERKILFELFKWFSVQPIVIDIGANKGDWSDVIMEKFYHENKIYMVEPNKKLLTYLDVKYEYNKNIVFCDFAAYKENDKKIDFYYFENFNNELSSIYYRTAFDDLPTKKMQVNAIRIDTFCKQNNIDEVDCIKIDAEGADYEVLLGCEELLKNKKVKFIQIEYGAHYMDSHTTFLDVIKLIGQYDYFAYDYNGEKFIQLDENFREEYKYKNYILTYISITRYNYTQLWNKEFIKNTAFLDKQVLFALEIGCFEGRTTNYICDHLLKEDGRIICVDPLADVYLVDDVDEQGEKMNETFTYFKGQYQRFIQNTRTRPVELIRKTSKDAYEDIKAYRFDFIYCDGDHREKSLYEDAAMCYEICQHGGYILFDDYEWNEGSKSALDRFTEEYITRIEVIFKEYQLLVKKI